MVDKKIVACMVDLDIHTKFKIACAKKKTSISDSLMQHIENTIKENEDV